MTTKEEYAEAATMCEYEAAASISHESMWLMIASTMCALADRLEQGAENGDLDTMPNVVSALREAHATIERLCAEKVNDSELVSALTETLRQVSDERDTLRELVREAYEEADLGWLGPDGGPDWDERAKKALEGSE